MSLENLSDHEKLFFNDGYELGKQAAGKVADEKAFLSFVGEAYNGIDSLINSILELAHKQNIRVDCKKGCSFCCHQAVFANSYELHYLGNFLTENFNQEQRTIVQQRATAKNKHTRKLSEEEQLNYKSPCPLLHEGMCSAYQARPMACRIYLSMSVASCLEFYHHPKNPDNYPQLMDFPLIAGRMMNEGFMTALKESGIAIAEFRLEDGLETFLKNGVNR